MRSRRSSSKPPYRPQSKQAMRSRASSKQPYRPQYKQHSVHGRALTSAATLTKLAPAAQRSSRAFQSAFFSSSSSSPGGRAADAKAWGVSTSAQSKVWQADHHSQGRPTESARHRSCGASVLVPQRSVPRTQQQPPSRARACCTLTTSRAQTRTTSTFKTTGRLCPRRRAGTRARALRQGQPLAAHSARQKKQGMAPLVGQHMC